MENYHADRVYLNGLKNILNTGVTKMDRTGTGTISLFGAQNRYDLTKGFPLLTSKKVYTRGVVGELLWFLQGRTDIQWLNDRNIHIWDSWHDDNNEIGTSYSWQWRYFNAPYIKQQDRDNGEKPVNGIDQIINVLRGIKDDPFSRRHIVSAWNPFQLDTMALPPCHAFFQFYVSPDEEGYPSGLSCQLYQRSCDAFLGEAFNIASYSILLQLFAELTGLVAKDFIHTIGDHHIYLNHLDQVNEQLSRYDNLPDMPELVIHHPGNLSNIDLSDPDLFQSYEIKDFEFKNYNPLSAIKAPVAV